MNTSRRSVAKHLGRWAAELLLVFVGAYAAFWLNNYQQHRDEALRHRQILAFLENEFSAAISNAQEEHARAERTATEFHRALDAGEMPRLGTFSFISDYNASDLDTMLQAGGYQVLDVKTIFAIRNFESVVRRGLTEISHIERLSDELIAPNLDQDIAFFYDPATKKLRKRFAHYPDALDLMVRFQNDLLAAETELLQQIKAERQRQ